MTQRRILQSDVPVSIAVPIQKSDVNAAARTVRGRMTQEVVDAHNEEIDFDSVVACLSTWRGNVREMHEPRAVGRAVEIVVLDDERAVEVESYISTGAEDTWQKCLDGTLGFYSIGGIGNRVSGTRSDGTIGPRVLMQRINELSLVDSGACPTATIAVVKLVGGTPVAQLAGREVRAADVAATIHRALDAALAPLRRKLDAHRATEDRTIAELQGQLRKLADATSPGAPVVVAGSKLIEKTFGGVSGARGEDPGAQLAAEVAKLGPDTPEDDRRAVVEKLLAWQQRTGYGAAFVPHGR
jgi:hypothetical protein